MISLDRRTRVIAAVAAVFAAGGLVESARARFASPPVALAAETALPPGRTAAGGAFGFAPVVKQAAAAVVNISSTKIVRAEGGSAQLSPLFERFFGEGPEIPHSYREHSLGSGVIIRPDGLVLTNSHVVEGATEVRVSGADKREYRARVLGSDPKTDIAVLKIDAQALPALPLGDSSHVQVGDVVLAVGNPFGIGQTVTMGIVSATGRGGLGIEDYEDFIQTDAAINPGNSGGALVNSQGELVGINTAILSRSEDGGNQGIGFAVPSNLAGQVMKQLLEHGRVIRGWLGVLPQPVTVSEARFFKLSQPEGALLGEVTPGSPAVQAGLQRGDILLRVNGQPISDINAFRLQIAMTPPGTQLRFEVRRDGQDREIAVRLAELPSPPERPVKAVAPSSPFEGLSVEELNPQLARRLRVPAGAGGVVIADIDSASPAAEAGLQSGDVIQEVDRKPVQNLDDFRRTAASAGKEPVLLLISRLGHTFYLAVDAA